MTRKRLSAGQEKVLAYIVAFHAKEDRFPSSREMQIHFGWSSQTAAVSYLEGLARKGYVEHRESPYLCKGWWRFVKEEDQTAPINV